MNNRSMHEDSLREFYIQGAMGVLRRYAEWHITELINPKDLWNEVMSPVFPEGLEPEDFGTFLERGEEQINGFFEAARERLST